MDKITQTARYRQAVITYVQKYGVTKAATRYHTNRQYIVQALWPTSSTSPRPRGGLSRCPTKDDYTGILHLDHISVQVTTDGYATKTGTISASRTYPNLSEAEQARLMPQKPPSTSPV